MAAPSPRILLVDDEPDFLTIGRALLRNTCGCEVETAASAKRALELLKSSQFDAVISDYIMPGMNGIELLKAVRSDDGTRNIAFILLTGQGEEKIAVDAINNGVDFYLPKGGDPTSRFTDIGHKVQWAIDRNQERQRKDEEQQRAKGDITHSSVAICSFHLDYEGNLIFDGSNSATEKVFKINAKTMAGKSIQEVIPGLDATPILERFKNIAETETTWDAEDVAISIGKESLVFDIQVFQITQSQFVATFTRKSDHPFAEQQQDPSGLYQSFISASPDVIVIADVSGDVTYISPRAGYVFRVRDIERVIGSNMLSWVHEDYRQQAAICIRQHLQGISVPPMIYRLIREDGSSFPAEIHSAPIWSEGLITGIIAIIRDNTERAAQHEALERANTKLNLLSSITRHDILNKITALRLYCSLIEDEEDPQQNKAMLKKIEEMAGIIADLVAFTSYYQNLGINTAQWIMPGKIQEKITEMLTPGRVSIQNGFGNVRILADPLFEKVLYNLFDNAIKYGQIIRTIKTWYEMTPEGLILVVTDDGVGIPNEEKEKVFDRSVGHGSGLGLFLSREILSVTNMTIQETGVYGKGARFEITIPHGNFRIPHEEIEG